VAVEIIDTAETRYTLEALLPTGPSLVLDEAIGTLTWEEQGGDLAVRLQVTLANTTLPDGSPLHESLPVGVWLSLLADWGEGWTEIFRGRAWQIKYVDPRVTSLEITAYDPLIYLAQSEDELLVPQGASIPALLKGIFTTYGIPIGDLSGAGGTMPKTTLRGSLSDWIAKILSEMFYGRDLYGVLRMRPDGPDYVVDVVPPGGNAIYILDETNVASLNTTISIMDLVTEVHLLSADDASGAGLTDTTGGGVTDAEGFDPLGTGDPGGDAGDGTGGDGSGDGGDGGDGSGDGSGSLLARRPFGIENPGAGDTGGSGGSGGSGGVDDVPGPIPPLTTGEPVDAEGDPTDPATQASVPDPVDSILSNDPLKLAFGTIRKFFKGQQGDTAEAIMDGAQTILDLGAQPAFTHELSGARDLPFLRRYHYVWVSGGLMEGVFQVDAITHNAVDRSMDLTLKVLGNVPYKLKKRPKVKKDKGGAAPLPDLPPGSPLAPDVKPGIDGNAETDADAAKSEGAAKAENSSAIPEHGDYVDPAKPGGRFPEN